MTDGIEPSEGAEDTRAPASDPPTQPHREVTQRVADADRDRTVTSLREHVVVGRLTLDEFSERVDNALVARTQGDLDALVADLPARAVPEPEATRRRARRRVIAVMGGARAKGRWRASGHTTAIAVMGGCQLDLRQAEIEGSEVVISAFSIMGGIEIVVPEGIDVELAGFSIMGGRHLKIRDVPVIPGSPRIIVRAFPIMGGVEVKSAPNPSWPWTAITPRRHVPRHGDRVTGAERGTRWPDSTRSGPGDHVRGATSGRSPIPCR